MQMSKELLKEIRSIVYQAMDELETRLEHKLEEKFTVKLKPINDRLGRLEVLTGELVTQMGKTMIDVEQIKLDFSQFRNETKANFSKVNDNLRIMDKRYCSLSQIYPELNMDYLTLNRRVGNLEQVVFNPAK